MSFKPCYKWNTFNTLKQVVAQLTDNCFKPCYKWNTFNTITDINVGYNLFSFKPCYKRNTFNTLLVKIIVVLLILF